MRNRLHLNQSSKSHKPNAAVQSLLSGGLAPKKLLGVQPTVTAPTKPVLQEVRLEELHYTRISKNDWSKFQSYPVFESAPEDKVFCKCKSPCGTSEKGCENAASCVECTDSNCHWGEDCRNRRLQRNCSVPIILAREGLLGVGAFLNKPGGVVRGDFVIEYKGVVLIDQEASQVQRDRTKDQSEHLTYMFALGVATVSSTSSGKPTTKVQHHIYVDAWEKGNCSRFINHSCTPNCETTIWFVGKIPHIGIFAKNNIDYGAPLSIHYNLPKNDGFQPFTCLCTSCNPKPNETSTNPRQHETTPNKFVEDLVNEHSDESEGDGDGDEHSDEIEGDGDGDESDGDGDEHSDESAGDGELLVSTKDSVNRADTDKQLEVVKGKEKVSTKDRKDTDEQVARFFGTSTGATVTANAPEAASQVAIGIFSTIAHRAAHTANNILTFFSISPTGDSSSRLANGDVSDEAPPSQFQATAGVSEQGEGEEGEGAGEGEGEGEMVRSCLRFFFAFPNL